jgi:adenylate cyclase
MTTRAARPTEADTRNGTGEVSDGVTLLAGLSLSKYWKASIVALLGEPAPTRLPARLNDAVANEQQQGERLIGWVEAAAVLAWALLYVASRKTSPASAPFEPVPWTLAAYGLFIAGRLLLSYRRTLSNWHVALSIVIDITVLMVLIWSFHLQYGQPPAFYLKAPTLLYVFIFIALRTLRFEPRWVVLAGAVSVIGWAALLIYPIWVQRAEAPITHDYVRYMTSSSILLGAEFDKIVSIVMVTAVLGVALHRARRLMMRCVFDHAAALELSRFVASGVAQKITRSEASIEPGQAELRSAAALFVDLRGFTALARQLSPRSVMKLLGEYQRRVVPVVQRHGGSIDKFLGDGIMASFGAVSTSDAYAAQALRAVDAIIEELAVWRGDRLAADLAAPGIGIAVASGNVLFGAVGDETRLEYTVIGDAVNLAAKLEKHAKAEQVVALTDRTTFELALAQGYVPISQTRHRSRRHIDGIGEAIDLVVLDR